MIPGLFMWPGMVGGRRSVASQLSAYPNLAAYFEAGLGESYVVPTTDPLSAWVASNATLVASGGTAPNGATEYTLKDDSTLATVHYAYSTVSNVTVGAGSKFRFIARAGSGSRWINVLDSSGGGNTYFDPTAGIVRSGSGTMAPLGGGYWLCEVDTFSWVNTVGQVKFRLHNGSSVNYDGDGTSSVYIALYDPFVEQAGSVSQLMSPIYVDPGGGAIDAPRKYIQTIDQAAFGKMPLRDTTGWGGGLKAIKGDGAAYYMSGVMGAAMVPPFGLLFVANNTSSGTVRQLICGTTASVGAYLTATDYLSYYDGSAASVISDAPIAAGKHIILVLVTATTVQAWIDGVAQTAVSVSSANLGAALNVMANAAGAASFFDSDIRSLGLYLGNWTTDGTRAGLESFLNSRAGGGLI